MAHPNFTKIPKQRSISAFWWMRTSVSSMPKNLIDITHFYRSFSVLMATFQWSNPWLGGLWPLLTKFENECFFTKYIRTNQVFSPKKPGKCELVSRNEGYVKEQVIKIAASVAIYWWYQQFINHDSIQSRLYWVGYFFCETESQKLNINVPWKPCTIFAFDKNNWIVI